MSKILEMKEKRANITNQIRGIIDQFEGKEMDPAKKDEINKLENAFDNFTDIINREEKQLERERMAGELEKKPVNIKNGEVDEKAKVYNAFIDVLKDGTREILDVYNALQLDNPTQAGNLVAPQRFVNELIADLDNMTFMRQI